MSEFCQGNLKMKVIKFSSHSKVNNKCLTPDGRIYKSQFLCSVTKNGVRSVESSGGIACGIDISGYTRFITH